MASNAEGKHRAEFVQSLANNNRSIENITITSGQNVGWRSAVEGVDGRCDFCCSGG